MKSYKITFIIVLLFTAFQSNNLFAQTEGKQASVIVEGELTTKLVLTSADIDKLPKTTLTAEDHSEKEHSYTGVELVVLLKNAGVTLGELLRGKNLTKYLLVGASDGYKVLFSLAEIDPVFSSHRIILANRKDGALLPADEGPFHIIIEGEKRKARNARQVISLKVKFAD